MTDLFFADTNLLVYQRDIRNPEKNQAAERWVTALWTFRRGRISFQILHELYAVLRRPPGPMPAQLARNCVAELAAWGPVAPSLDILERAWQIQDRYSVSWWDALVLASAAQSGCRYLLTEDLAHGQDYGGVQVVNPFRTRPDELGLA